LSAILTVVGEAFAEWSILPEMMHYTVKRPDKYSCESKWFTSISSMKKFAMLPDVFGIYCQIDNTLTTHENPPHF
jgi:hypothetical protein